MTLTAQWQGCCKEPSASCPVDKCLPGWPWRGSWISAAPPWAGAWPPVLGVSGFAGMGAWIQAWGKDRAAATQDAIAAHLPPSANLHGVKDTPAHSTHPMVCLTPGKARSAAVQAEFQHWGLSHPGYWGVLSAPRTCTMPSPTLLSAPSWVPGPAAAPFQPLSSSYTGSTRSEVSLWGTLFLPTPHNQHNQPATSSHNGASISPHSA